MVFSAMERFVDANHPWLKEIHPEPLIRTLVEAIRIPSPTGSEREMGEYCAERMRRAGLEVTEATLRPESPNFVGRLTGDRPGLSLCYHAHTDTVPPGDPGTLTKDPFAGVVENGRVFGRGASTSSRTSPSCWPSRKSSPNTGSTCPEA